MQDPKPITTGVKYDSGKLRYDLVNPDAHRRMVEILTFGAQKYDARNWEKGMPWSRLIASLKRHLAAIEAGEDFDPESGKLHIDHLACNAHFLSAYYKLHPWGDDRPHAYLNPPKIGLDIDEVLCDWLGTWCKLHNLPLPTSWGFHRQIVEEFDKMEKDNKIEEFYLNLPALLKPEDIPFEPHCYITSRRVPNELTTKWLDKNGFPVRPVYTVPPNTSKVEVARQSGIDIFVDDRYENFIELNKAGILTYLYDAPHNRRYNVGFKRIKSLKELV
jgi:hypothetical protein